ncbi:MAG: UDP-N-acetylglucosamine 2-epimerase (non-hydrolyzing) [Deltaproteobacteria bacterium]|nr:UDP-N-acetylglucosamine 2-epimerase (non-hydrolyzing) [Deltaproteobacteria bacterium]
MKVHLIAGARPNFVKLAPLAHTLRERDDIDYEIVHTGQHYDDALSGSFFRVLDIPAPDIDLGVGSASQPVQVARILEAIEPVFAERRPDAVVVFGDVNSTMAAAFAAASLQIPSVHVEAGLRSFDRAMPEEINRVVADSLASLLLASEPSGVANLEREGASPDRVHLVGNIMIDSLKRLLPEAEDRRVHDELGLEQGGYGFLTMHRPSNVDDPSTLAGLLDVLEELSATMPLVFPIHPRTRKNAESFGLSVDGRGQLLVVPPVDYVGSLSLQRHAAVVLTDSGGIQEESTCLGVPCLTLRDNTERPITVEQGTSTLVGNDSGRIRSAFAEVVDGSYKKGQEIELWDGQAAGRIADLLTSRL